MKRLTQNKILSGFLLSVIFSIHPGNSLSNESASNILDPIAHWSLDEGYGDVLWNSKSYSYPGEINGAKWSKDCIKGNCLVFNGKDDSVEIPHNTKFNFWDKQGTDFTIVVLPDTQYYSLFFNPIFFQQTQWIVKNIKKLNIKFVIHVGDIVNNNSIPEWRIAKKAMELMDGRVPYLVVPGNHDIYPAGNHKKKDYKNYNTFFPYSDYEKYPWYGGGITLLMEIKIIMVFLPAMTNSLL